MLGCGNQEFCFGYRETIRHPVGMSTRQPVSEHKVSAYQLSSYSMSNNSLPDCSMLWCNSGEQDRTPDLGAYVSMGSNRP